MSKSNGIAVQKFVAVAERLGFNVKTNSGWLKLTKEGSENKAVYVSNKSTGLVTMVHISGYSAQGAGIIACRRPPTKRVTQELDFSQSEVDVLRAFAEALKQLSDAPALVSSRGGKKSVDVPAPSQAELDAATLAALSE